MAKKIRVDRLMIARGLTDSVAKAQALILAGEVVVNDQRVDKPGTAISPDAFIRLKGEPQRYVSRGGYKLEAALKSVSISCDGLVCADIGASTGGFTDCLLQHGAAKVYAIDVGRGQLHQKLRVDSRVIQRDRINARALDDEILPEPVQLAVIDVSFISLRHVVVPLLSRMATPGWLVALVKPHFESRPDEIESGGVVRSDDIRQAIVDRTVAWFSAQGLTIVTVIESPILGPAGNREVLLVATQP